MSTGSIKKFKIAWGVDQQQAQMERSTWNSMTCAISLLFVFQILSGKMCNIYNMKWNLYVILFNIIAMLILGIFFNVSNQLIDLLTALIILAKAYKFSTYNKILVQSLQAAPLNVRCPSSSTIFHERKKRSNFW